MHMVTLYAVWYNFVRVAERLWSTDDLCEAMDTVAPKPGPRGPYMKRQME